jgi:hypothetical protein
MEFRITITTKCRQLMLHEIKLCSGQRTSEQSFVSLCRVVSVRVDVKCKVKVKLSLCLTN